MHLLVLRDCNNLQRTDRIIGKLLSTRTLYVSDVPEDCREGRTVLEKLLQANRRTFCTVNQATEVAFLIKCHRQSRVYLLSISI